MDIENQIAAVLVLILPCTVKRALVETRGPYPADHT
jgi:hypothetical protein